MQQPASLALALSMICEARRSAVPLASVTIPATASRRQAVGRPTAPGQPGRAAPLWLRYDEGLKSGLPLGRRLTQETR